MTPTDPPRGEMADLSRIAVTIADIYAERFGTPRDAGWALHKLSEELGEMTGAWLQRHGQGRGTASPEDLRDEVADVLGFLLVFAAAEGIDAGAALRDKWGRHLPQDPSPPDEERP